LCFGGVFRMTAANDNRHARNKRVRAHTLRSLATMTRIIQDIYGPDSTKHQEPAPIAEDAPKLAAGSWEETPATSGSESGDTVAH